MTTVSTAKTCPSCKQSLPRYDPFWDRPATGSIMNTIRYLQQMVCFAAASMAASLVSADIVVDSVADPHTLIAVHVTNANTGIPEEAKSNWTVLIEGADCAPAKELNTWYTTGMPGKYSIIAFGSWVQTDADGKLINFGSAIQSASFAISKEDPNPDPPDPLPPPQDRWVIIIEETEQRTPEHANLYNRLRAKGTAKVLIADRDAEADTIRQYVGRLDEDKKLPVAFITDSGGKIYHQVELPDTVEEVEALLQ